MELEKQWRVGIPEYQEAVSLEEVENLVREGRLKAADMVKRPNGMWQEAGTVNELAACFAPPPAADIPAEEVPVTEDAPAIDIPAEDVPATEDTPPPRVARFVHLKAGGASPAAPPQGAEEKPEPKRRFYRPVEPMAMRPFTTADLFRASDPAFQPKRLLLAAAIVIPAAALLGLGAYFFWEIQDRTGRAVLFWAEILVAALVVGLVTTMLAFVTRRQLEGTGYTAREAFGHMGSNLDTALLYPVVTLLPLFAVLGGLWLVGIFRNLSSATASFLKLVYIFPMILGFMAVAAILFFQFAAIYIPSAAAAEAQKLGAALKTFWAAVGRQRGRAILQWLVMVVMTAVVGAVSLTLVLLAFHLPEAVFPLPDGPEESAAVHLGWSQFGWLFAVYKGLALGIGLVFPVSLFSTLGMISYLAIRVPAPPARKKRPDPNAKTDVFPQPSKGGDVSVKQDPKTPP